MVDYIVPCKEASSRLADRKQILNYEWTLPNQADLTLD